MSKKKYSKMIVAAAISAIIAFTVAETFLLFYGTEGYPDVFVRCWFTFWSVEVSALAGIKIVETRHDPYCSKDSFPSEEDIAG